MTVTIRFRSLISVVAAALAGAAIAWIIASATAATAAPADVEMTTVPITSCRLTDTRPATQVGPRSTPLGPDDTYTVDARDATTECAGKIPATAAGLVLNVTADETTQLTFLTVWDSGPWPGTSSMNPAPGPPVPNAVTTKLADDDTFRIYNRFGSTHVVIDITAYLLPAPVTELEARMTAMEAEIDVLQAKLASMSAVTVDGRPTVRFSGVNVQVVDGSGDSQCSVSGYEACTGVGNLIVGYSEGFGGKARTGSHNIVAGMNNDWTSHSGLVAGWTNTISGSAATITGGSFNEASGSESSISGGRDNQATGTWSSVSGGDGNSAQGFSSSVVGGLDNLASGTTATVAGGDGNEASGTSATVAGGLDGIASGTRATTSGGSANRASGASASVSGGSGNFATNLGASISGGSGNFATGQNSTVAGGNGNTASGNRTSIVGGTGCLSNVAYGVVVGATVGTTCTQLN